MLILEYIVFAFLRGYLIKTILYIVITSIGANGAYIEEAERSRIVRSRVGN